MIYFINNGTDALILEHLHSPMAEELCKAIKNSNLIEVVRPVQRDGKTFFQTFHVKPEEVDPKTDRIQNRQAYYKWKASQEKQAQKQAETAVEQKKTITPDITTETTIIKAPDMPSNKPEETKPLYWKSSKTGKYVVFDSKYEEEKCNKDEWEDEEFGELIKSNFLNVTTSLGQKVTYAIAHHLELHKEERPFTDPEAVKAAVHVLTTSKATTPGTSPSGATVYWGEETINGKVVCVQVSIQDMYDNSNQHSGLLTLYTCSPDEYPYKWEHWCYYKEHGHFRPGFVMKNEYGYKKRHSDWLEEKQKYEERLRERNEQTT